MIGNHVSLSVSITMKHMKHAVRTAYGISNETFQQDETELWSRIGQESAAEGPMWISQEAIMLEYFCKETRGEKLLAQTMMKRCAYTQLDTLMTTI